MSCYLNHSFRAFYDKLVKSTMLRFYNTDLCEDFKLLQVLLLKYCSDSPNLWTYQDNTGGQQIGQKEKRHVV